MQQNLLTAEGFKLLQSRGEVHLLEGACWAAVKGLKLVCNKALGPEGDTSDQINCKLVSLIPSVEVCVCSGSLMDEEAESVITAIATWKGKEV